MRYSLKGTERVVDRAMSELDEAITAIAAGLREERVIPACRRIGGSFCSGMGTFSFYDRQGIPILEEDSRRYGLASIYEALNIQVYNENYLGFWVRDVEKA